MTKQFTNVADPRNTFTPTDTIGTFGSAIGAVILNSQNQVLLTQRTDTNDMNPGIWKMTLKCLIK